MANRHYPEEFKRDVVALARKGEVPKKQIADDMGIAETTLYRWIARYDTDREDRSGASSDELAELTSLRKRVRRLEQENEILRRATAYFAKDAAPK